MDTAPPPAAAAVNAALQTALDAATHGHGPDTIALMRVLGEAATEAEARAGLADALAACEDPDGSARLRRLQHLWDAHPQAWSVVRSTLAGIAHDRRDADPAGVLRYWATAFDRLAAASPEASVALYSLGSADLLAAASDEIVDLLDRLGLLGPTHDALDLGCGIGRLLVPLAQRLRSIRGLDISAGMVTQARRRCADLPNVTVALSGGHDLDGIADRSLDLVVAADVFPYLVQAGGGLLDRHVAAFARVLRPGAAAVILNVSYRGDLDRDRRDIAGACGAAGLAVERDGTSDLKLWDARTFLLRAAAQPEMAAEGA